MDKFPTPSAIILPPISTSAPESRRGSTCVTPRGAAAQMRPSSVSQPVSPIYKKPQRTIGKKELQDTPTAPLRSPARALRKHIYAATFATHNPRKDAKEDACPVHSYSSVDAIEKILPNKHAAHGVRWGDTKRDASLRPNCPVHSYDSEPKSARPVGPATFPKHDERATG